MLRSVALRKVESIQLAKNWRRSRAVYDETDGGTGD